MYAFELSDEDEFDFSYSHQRSFEKIEPKTEDNVNIQWFFGKSITGFKSK